MPVLLKIVHELLKNKDIDIDAKDMYGLVELKNLASALDSVAKSA